MGRTKAIFDKVFSLPLMASKDHSLSTWSNFLIWYRSFGILLFGDLYYHHKHVSLEYVSVESGISDAAILEARTSRELKSLQSFLKFVAPQWQSFHQLHNWLFTQHSAYAASRLINQDQNRKQVDQEALKSY